MDAPISRFLVAQDYRDGFTNLGMVGRKAKVFYIQKGVVAGNPLGLVKTTPPVTVLTAALEELGAPALGSDPLPQGRQLRAQQVAMDLILRGGLGSTCSADD